MNHIKLADIVDVLFAEFEKVNNATLTGDKLYDQLNRTKTVVSIAKQIVDTASLGLEAQKSLPEMLHGAVIPTMLRIDK